ncbi:MAG: hypothetical protein ACFFC7_31460 [Candidatus Hermodarchaeota archaeon]
MSGSRLGIKFSKVDKEDFLRKIFQVEAVQWIRCSGQVEDPMLNLCEPKNKTKE